MEIVTRTHVNFVWLTATFSLISSVGIATVAVPSLALEVLLGMAAPVLVAIISSARMEQAYQQSPEHLTRLLFRAFACKMVIFASYVVFAIGVLSLKPIAFITCFTVYYLALHLAEAVQLQRIYLSNGTPTS